jgi:hypothetical protein
MTQNFFGSSGGISIILTDVNSTRLIYHANFPTFINGSDGERSRLVGLNNTGLSRDELVVVDNYALQPTIDYTVVHQVTNSTIQFLNPLWDDQTIMIDFFTTGSLNYTLNSTSVYGVSFGGASGDRFRTYTILGSTTREFITIDNFVLMETQDYNVSRSPVSTNITFFNPIWNDQYATIRWLGVGS